jgi:hypothetical protein
LFAQRHYCPGNHALGLQVEVREQGGREGRSKN